MNCMKFFPLSALILTSSLFCMDINKELQNLYQADQEDRQNFHTYGIEERQSLQERDQIRKLRALQIMDTQQDLSGMDYFHAAMIFQHGNMLEDYWMAYSLAKKSVDLGCCHNKWLMAAAYDRWCMFQGKPQKYGTQLINKGDGWQIWETDPLTTDAEREELYVPSLAEQEKRCKELNEMYAQAAKL